MYILDFLKDPTWSSVEHKIEVEYRLVSSGAIYNADIITTDWTKSDGPRLIVRNPISLIVTSQPIDAYPQELALRFFSGFVSETIRNHQSIFSPDKEISDDFCSILSLFTRRLIKPFTRVRAFDQESTLPDFVDFPSPIILQPPPIYWPSQPSTVLFDPGGIRQLYDYNPTPKGVPSTELENILKSLPSSPYAESFIKSSRLYSTALELIDAHTEIAYELLIFSIEALANPVFSDFTPTEQELAAAKPIVAQLTKKLGLTGEQSLAMLTAASSGMNWSQKKYLRFIMENISSEELAEKDDLFNWDQDLAPKTLSEIQSRLTKTYRARGSSLHQGEQFPVRSRISLSRVPARELTKYYFGDKEIPPIEWMERVTNLALTSFLKKNLGISSASKNNI